MSQDAGLDLRALEREVVELQELSDSTGEREQIKVLKIKKSQLCQTCWVFLLWFVSKMEAPSHCFFSLERRNGQIRLCTVCRPTAAAAGLADICRNAVAFCEEKKGGRVQGESRGGAFNEARAELETQLSAEELQSLESGLPADLFKAF